MGNDLTAVQLLADFQRMLSEGWGYIPGASGQRWTQADQDRSADAQVRRYGQQWVGRRVADCSGAFVYAYRQRGLALYHGSNRIAREHAAALLPISEARPGMAAFKYRRPGDRYYALPQEYRPGGGHANGDLLDYYHIGLVDAEGRHVINAQSTATGVRRSDLTGWHAVAWLKEVRNMPEKTATVTAANGKPVNLRKSPALTAGRVAAVPTGAQVAVLDASDAGWAQVRYGDKTGYMMREYLIIKEETAPESRLERLRELLRQAAALAEEMEGG